ncbi:MAG: 50S ribosomal protein L21 [candidate division WOR-3 bacterium]
MFAVFEAKGFQYIGNKGDKLKIPRLNNKIGETVTFDKVLLLKNGDLKIGQPYVEGASVVAEVVSHGKYDKILVFKFKRRNRYRRKRGHTQTYTEIEIKDILLGKPKEETIVSEPIEEAKEIEKIEMKEKKEKKAKGKKEKTKTTKKTSTKTTKKGKTTKKK